MAECPRCNSVYVSVERGACTGWLLEADRCRCWDCGNEWLENERSVVEDDDANKEL